MPDLASLLSSVGKYGLMPVLVVYLIYTMVSFNKEIRADNKAIQDKIDALSNKVADAIDKQADQIGELTKVIASLHSAITTQVNTIMVYLFNDRSRGGQ